MKATSCRGLARAPVTLQLETQTPLTQTPQLLQLAFGWMFLLRKGYLVPAVELTILLSLFMLSTPGAAWLCTGKSKAAVH